MDNWNDIPQELLDLIATKIFATDRHTFRLVSSSWNAAVTGSPFRHSPCLIVNNQKSNKPWKLFQHISFFSMDLPKIVTTAKIRFSNHGWLLMMCPDDETLFFFHPFSKQIIELPPSDETDYTTMCFFHPPTSPDCIVFGIQTILSPKIFDRVEIGILKHGEDSWKRTVYRREKREFKVSIGPPVLHDGRLYFLDVRGNVAYLNINEDKWVVHSRCLKSRRLRRDINEHYLVKPKGESTIFAVFVVHDESMVKVFKLMRPGNLWELVEDLGEMVFYVSNTSSFGYRTDDKRIANKIFFTKYHSDKIVYYSLDTRKYHSFEGNYSSNDAYGLKKLDFGTWTMPTQIDSQLSRELTWCQQVEKAAT